MGVRFFDFSAGCVDSTSSPGCCLGLYVCIFADCAAVRLETNSYSTVSKLGKMLSMHMVMGRCIGCGCIPTGNLINKPISQLVE